MVEKLSENEESCRLKFSIDDTGIGIPLDKRERLFQSFSQLDDSTTRVYGGSGLGLNISKKLLELMGGSIGFASEYGKGSIFYFILDLKKAGVDSEKIILDPNLLRVPIKAMIVDDSASALLAIAKIFTSWQISSQQSKDFLTALPLMREHQNHQGYNLLLLDSELVDADSFLSFRELNEELPEHAQIEMVLLANTNSAISLHKFRELGIRYHITKPIMPADLNRLVQRLFSKTQPVEDLSDKPDFPSLVRTRRISVLLVEDQLINRKIVVGLLQRKNVDITIAENGEEAVEKTKERRFDLILMDVQMPKMDGLEATRIIRKHEKEQNYHTPIIAMTAHAMKGDKEKGLEAGMDNYITKPVNTKVLFDIIDKYSVQVL